MHRWLRTGVVVVLVAATAVVGGAGASAAEREDWVWPVDGPVRITARFAAPAHDYAPGHRGIDLEPLGSGGPRAPAAGVVAFSGKVAGRGVITIDHGRGYVTTLEPVESDLVPGMPVTRGDPVGSLAAGGHAAAGQLHFGVRLHGEYINPMLLLGGVPRAVLVPCCDPL